MKKILILGFLLIVIESASGDSFNQIKGWENPSDPNDFTWRLNKDMVHEKFGPDIDLFAATRSVTCYATEWSYDHSHKGTTVVADHLWNRIIIACEFGSIITGRTTSAPTGIASSTEGLIFITSASRDRLNVWWFDRPGWGHDVPQNAQVISPTSWQIPGGPVDVCWDDGRTAEWGDDAFWVASVDLNMVRKYRYTFEFPSSQNPWQSFTFELKVTIPWLDRPISVARGRQRSVPGGYGFDEYGHNDWLYILEEAGTIQCYESEQTGSGNNATEAYFRFSYPITGNTHLTSLAVDHEGIIWGTDITNSRLLTYYNNGEELLPLDTIMSYGTANQPGYLTFPRDISMANSRWYHDDPTPWYSIYPCSTVVVAELWDNTTGGVQGERGYAIKNFDVDWALPLDPYTRPLIISYLLTSYGDDDDDLIIENVAHQVIRTIQLPTIPGPHEILWDGKDDNGQQTPEAVYTFKISSLQTIFDTHLPPNYLKDAISGTLQPNWGIPYYIYDNAWVQAGDEFNMYWGVDLIIYPDKTLTVYGIMNIDNPLQVTSNSIYVYAPDGSGYKRLEVVDKAVFQNGAVIKFPTSTALSTGGGTGNEDIHEPTLPIDEISKPEKEKPLKPLEPTNESFEKSEQKKENEGPEEKKKPEPKNENKNGIIKQKGR